MTEPQKLTAEYLEELTKAAFLCEPETCMKQLIRHIAALDEEIAELKCRYTAQQGFSDSICNQRDQLRAENDRLKNGVNKIIGMEPILPIHPLIKKELKHLIQTVPVAATEGKMIANELFRILALAIHDGHGDAMVLYDTEAQTFHCHMVPVDSAYCQEALGDGEFFVTLHSKKRQPIASTAEESAK